ncbi:protein of unknown function [Paraburkholderia kururiensis]
MSTGCPPLFHFESFIKRARTQSGLFLRFPNI